MSTPMITGDERRRGGDRYPDDSSAIFITIDRQNVETATGLDLLTQVVIDQHFVRRSGITACSPSSSRDRSDSVQASTSRPRW
ncbi:MAG: hypothetical protein IPK85_00895 [Gemmatimonadetes bacterium]|nr:hypothetical protein [Gemmatimonadota bacterium]